MLFRLPGGLLPNAQPRETAEIRVLAYGGDEALHGGGGGKGHIIEPARLQRLPQLLGTGVIVNGAVNGDIVVRDARRRQRVRQGRGALLRPQQQDFALCRFHQRFAHMGGVVNFRDQVGGYAAGLQGPPCGRADGRQLHAAQGPGVLSHAPQAGPERLHPRRAGEAQPFVGGEPLQRTLHSGTGEDSLRADAGKFHHVRSQVPQFLRQRPRPVPGPGDQNPLSVEGQALKPAQLLCQGAYAPHNHQCGASDAHLRRPVRQGF